MFTLRGVTARVTNPPPARDIQSFKQPAPTNRGPATLAHPAPCRTAKSCARLVSDFDPLRTLEIWAIFEPMEQQTESEALAEAMRHSTGNRQEIEASKYAGCLSCCTTFDARDIVDWQDEWTAPEKRNRVQRWTAKCPRCGRPMVIGSVTGLLDNQAYLPVVSDMLARQPNKRR